MQKQNEQNNLSVERAGWNAENLAEEASNKEPDEIVREMLRGDETEGEPNERDLAGGVVSSETPHGREEAKPVSEKYDKQGEFSNG